MKKLQLLRITSRDEETTKTMLQREAPDIIPAAKSLGMDIGERRGTKQLIREHPEKRARLAHNMRKYGMVRG